MRVVTTYRMNHTSLESAQTNSSEGVYRLKKESRSLKDVTQHHMEDIMGRSVLMQKSGKVDFFGQPCMKTQRISSGGVEHVRGMGTSIQEMSCHSPTTYRSNSSMSVVLIHGTISKVKELRVHLGGS
jgi:hypothetical protein